MPKRYVKLGRKALDVTIGHHWAVQVESYDEDGTGDWYEIAGASKNDGNSPNKHFALVFFHLPAKTKILYSSKTSNFCESMYMHSAYQIQIK